MKKALFAGSFDPPTLGHLDIIERSTTICDTLIVGILKNSEKKEFFKSAEKVEMLKTITKQLPHVEIVEFAGLTVDFAKDHSINFLIRGLRAYTDLEFEFRMALANKKIGEIETVFLMANPNLSHIRSSFIREFASHNTRLHDFVPAEIETIIYDRLKK